MEVFTNGITETEIWVALGVVICVAVLGTIAVRTSQKPPSNVTKFPGRDKNDAA